MVLIQAGFPQMCLYVYKPAQSSELCRFLFFCLCLDAFDSIYSHSPVSAYKADTYSQCSPTRVTSHPSDPPKSIANDPTVHKGLKLADINAMQTRSCIWGSVGTDGLSALLTLGRGLLSILNW